MDFLTPRSEVIQVYNGRLKIYSDGHVAFRKYDRKLQIVSDGYEPVKTGNPSQIASNVPKTQKKEQGLCVIREDNLSRSRSLLIDLAYSNYRLFLYCSS